MKDAKAGPVSFKIYLFQRSGAVNTASVMVSLPDIAAIKLAFYQLSMYLYLVKEILQPSAICSKHIDA